MERPEIGQFWNMTPSKIVSKMSDIDVIRNPENLGEVELFWRRCYDDFERQFDAVNNDSVYPTPRFVLHGPDGVGKSCMLLALTLYADSLGWIVLYVGNCSSMAQEPSGIIARKIIEILSSMNAARWPTSFPSLDISGLNDEEVMNRVIMILSAMRNTTKLCCFIAIDQWNVLCNSSTNAYLKQLFGHFNTLNIARGASFAAVSSSFAPPAAGMFRDADAFTHRMDIHLFDAEEQTLIIQHMRANGKLPALGCGLDDVTIAQTCGRVGRMLAFAQLIWTANPSPPWTVAHTTRLNEISVSHYADRVTSLLRAEYTTNERHRVLSYVALLFLNKHPSHQLRESMPDAFRCVGLFDMSVEPITPVCPAVTVGIYRAMMDVSSATLKLLSDHPGTSGIALEWFVERYFRKTPPVLISLDVTDLTGKKTSKLELSVNTIRVQDAVEPAAVLHDIIDGTLIVCCPNHGVVDMVLYCHGIVCFIQISMFSYMMNPTKIEHLASTYVRGTEESVGSFYTRRAPAAWNVPILKNRFTQAVGAKIKYLYVTPDNTAHPEKSITNASKYVLRLGGDNLRSLGNEAAFFLNK